MNTAVKPYPSCRYGHAGIDAALALRAANDLKPAEITAVTLGLPRAGMMLIGQPAEKKADPQNVVDGQFSGPFVISAALATGAMGWDSYGLLRDATVRGAAAEGDLRVRSGDRGGVPRQHVRQADHRGARPELRAEGGGAEGRADELPHRGGAARRNSPAWPTRCWAPNARRGWPTRCWRSTPRRTSPA